MIARTRADDAADRVSFDEARALMLAAATPLNVETIALDRAYGRIVARPLYAADDIVPYARSAMDGYALCAADTQTTGGQPVALRISGAGFAGEEPAALVRGTAQAIATGAALPAGADAVVPIEDVKHGRGSIVLQAPLQPADHVFLAGDDAKQGDILARRGDVITPGRAALLAAAGQTDVGVHRRPRVAIVCTGDEIVPVSELPGPGQVRNSNAAMLAASVVADGGELVSITAVPDKVGPLRAALKRELANCDLLITTGGASVGQRDLVKATLTSLGARFAFRSVAMRPSKPTAFARVGNTSVAVLPGNPAAAFVGYASLVRGFIRRLAGRTVGFPGAFPATLRGTTRSKAGRHFLLFGFAERVVGEFTVVPLDNQCSSLVRTSADANCLIVLPPGIGNIGNGATVSIEMLDWSELP
jgi:molybdopterin molybdotransferase